ncbi:unnamed protein product [Phytomonas sp. EM1]|nr:unnamed protein product [Phytomonas sp. EM1]|eukprot:CCW60950.1 unnamed protein product [Phytomonas sp. isolate EM1]
MGFLIRLYHHLADQERLEWLMGFAMYDERVYEVVNQHHLVPSILQTLPYSLAAQFLARGMCYDSIREEVVSNFPYLCRMLSSCKTVAEGAALSSLIGNCGLLEQQRMQILCHDEVYQLMILSDSIFAQRAALRLLAYACSDDSLSDTVVQLQYRSDILKHINKVFVSTPDVVSRRLSLRCLALMGGFNESRADVKQTEASLYAISQVVPEFMAYFLTTFVYVGLRMWLRRASGAGKRWEVHRRAFFSSMYCGLLGVYCGSILEYRLNKCRVLYARPQKQYKNPRKDESSCDIAYTENSYLNLNDITQRVRQMQLTTYGITTSFLLVSSLRLTQVTFPAWMGDVAWRYPFVPRLFPALVGLPTASRCLAPFVVVPFTIVYVLRPNNWGTSFYDYYIGMWM